MVAMFTWIVESDMDRFDKFDLLTCFALSDYDSRIRANATIAAMLLPDISAGHRLQLTAALLVAANADERVRRASTISLKSDYSAAEQVDRDRLALSLLRLLQSPSEADQRNGLFELRKIQPVPASCVAAVEALCAAGQAPLACDRLKEQR